MKTVTITDPVLLEFIKGHHEARSAMMTAMECMYVRLDRLHKEMFDRILSVHPEFKGLRSSIAEIDGTVFLSAVDD